MRLRRNQVLRGPDPSNNAGTPRMMVHSSPRIVLPTPDSEKVTARPLRRRAHSLNEKSATSFRCPAASFVPEARAAAPAGSYVPAPAGSYVPADQAHASSCVAAKQIPTALPVPELQVQHVVSSGRRVHLAVPAPALAPPAPPVAPPA